jgi:hypothetical protein
MFLEILTPVKHITEDRPQQEGADGTKYNLREAGLLF